MPGIAACREIFRSGCKRTGKGREERKHGRRNERNQNSRGSKVPSSLMGREAGLWTVFALCRGVEEEGPPLCEKWGPVLSMNRWSRGGLGEKTIGDPNLASDSEQRCSFSNQFELVAGVRMRSPKEKKQRFALLLLSDTSHTFFRKRNTKPACRVFRCRAGRHSGVPGSGLGYTVVGMASTSCQSSGWVVLRQHRTLPARCIRSICSGTASARLPSLLPLLPLQSLRLPGSASG